MQKEPKKQEGWLKRMGKYIFKKGGGYWWVVFFIFVEADLMANIKLFSFPGDKYFIKYPMFFWVIILFGGLILSIGILLHRLVYTPKKQDFDEVYNGFCKLSETLSEYISCNESMKKFLEPKLDSVWKAMGNFGNKYFSWIDD